MLPESIELIIVTPERQLLRESVVEVAMPGANGELGILPGHAPLMTELGIGELSYRGAGANPQRSSRDHSRVSPKCCRTASPCWRKPPSAPRKLTLRAPKPRKARAEKRLASGDPNIDWDRAFIALQRALIRIQVARKYRGAPVETR